MVYEGDLALSAFKMLRAAAAKHGQKTRKIANMTLRRAFSAFQAGIKQRASAAAQVYSSLAHYQQKMTRDSLTEWGRHHHAKKIATAVSDFQQMHARVALRDRFQMLRKWAAAVAAQSTRSQMRTQMRAVRSMRAVVHHLQLLVVAQANAVATFLVILKIRQMQRFLCLLKDGVRDATTMALAVQRQPVHAMRRCSKTLQINVHLQKAKAEIRRRARRAVVEDGIQTHARRMKKVVSSEWKKAARKLPGARGRAAAMAAAPTA